MKNQALKIKEPKQRIAFLNNYRAAVLAAMALLICFVSSAQSDSTKYSPINGYGFKYKRVAYDSIFLVPLSSSPHTPYRAGALRYKASDSTLQIWTGFQWSSIITGVGNGVDTAYALNDSIIAIETPDQNFFVTLPGRHWNLQGVLNNGSTLTENEVITLADSIKFTSGFVIIDSLRLPALSTRTDTTTYKPLIIDASGNVSKMVGWPIPPSIDTANKWINNLRRRAGTDTVEYLKNGTWQFAFIDSSGDAVKINGHTITKSFLDNTKWLNGQVPTFDNIDSVFYPDLPESQTVTVTGGAGSIHLGDSRITSASVNPASVHMHGTIIAKAIGGTFTEWAVGGTGIHWGDSLLTRAWKLPKDRTQAFIWEYGIECRNDSQGAADSAVRHSGRFAACMAFRDTTISTSQMTFTGSWSDWDQGIYAGSMTNGKITSTAGDYYEFTVSKKAAFFTFFSKSPSDDTPNFTDSITVSVDGVYYGSYSTAKIGFASGPTDGGAYVFAIVLQNLGAGSHTIRVTNQRAKKLAIDFAGALKDPVDCAPVILELIAPLGDQYQAGLGYTLKQRFPSMNNEYVKDVYNTWQKFGYPIIAADPTRGLDMTANSSDGLHQDITGQSITAKSMLQQINITNARTLVVKDSILRYGDILVGTSGGHATRTDSLFWEPGEGMTIGTGTSSGGNNSILKLRSNNTLIWTFRKDGGIMRSGAAFFQTPPSTFNHYSFTGNLTGTGSGNIGIGVPNSTAMGGITSGQFNVAIGGEASNGAGQNLTSGSSNTAIGRAALMAATTANENTAFGGLTLISTTGNGNTAIGFRAGAGNTSGTFNTYLGYYAGRQLGATNLTNVTVIANDFSDNLTTGLTASNVLVAGLNQSVLLGKVTNDGVGKLQVAGKITVSTHTVASNADSAVIWDRSTNEYKVAKINGNASITSINSQTGPAITIQSGTATSVSNGSNTVTINVTPTSLSLPHTLNKQYADANNTGTGETDLYTYTLPANTLNINDRSIHFEISGQSNDATATTALRVYFAGTSFGNTGAVTLSNTGAWSARGNVVRTGTTTARAYVVFTLKSGATDASYTFQQDLTSLDFTVGNIFKITGQSGGAGGGDNDITAKSWVVKYQPE